MAQTIIHLLAVHSDKNGTFSLRGTLRTGEIHPGQSLRFSAKDGTSRVLDIKEVNQRDRNITLVIEGQEEEVGKLRNGVFLYGVLSSAT